MVNSWKNASLRTRLMVSFAVPVALLALMGLVGQRAASSINDNVNAVAEVRLPIIVNLLEADRDFHQALVAERTLALGRVTGEAAAKLRTEIAENQEQANERIAKAAELAVTPEERELVSAFNTDRDTWHATMTRLLEDAEAGRFDAAVALSTGELNTQFGAMREHVNKLEEVSVKLAAAAHDDAEATYASSRMTLAVVTLIGIAFAAALAWSVSRWVARRVGTSAEHISESATAVADAAGEISASAQTLSSGATQQAASLEETSASMEELSAMTRQNAEHTGIAATTMADAARLAGEATSALSAMSESMTAIRESSNQVGRIIKTIDEIAFQTNILALNAAVEAARAGEAGLGFAVVADEVRALAQRAAQAARDTAALIEESIRCAGEGESRAGAVSAVIGSMTESTSRVKTLIDDISQASRQQSQGLQQIATAIQEMERVTQTTAASAEEGAAASEELRASAEAARQAVDDLMALAGVARADETVRNNNPRRTVAMVGTRAAVIACAVVAGTAGSAAAQDLGRWVDVQAFNVAARYKFVQDDQNIKTSHDVQDNTGFKGRVKADRAGRIAMNVGVFTGSSFASGWNNTGIGAAELSQPMNVKQLYLSVSPLKGVDAQVGSLYAARGENTEITHYDNDGFLTGERLTVKRPAQVFFDEITVTNGYLGDLKTPNAFERGDSLNDFNYRQMLVGKKIGKRVAMSVEWTDAADQEIWRGAVGAKMPRFVDAVRVEFYARPDADAQGGAVSIERTLPRKIAVAAGYANLDGQVGALTGDKFGPGERVFGTVKMPLVNALSVDLFYTHGLSNAFAVANDQRFDVVVSYNVLAAFQKRGAK